VKTVVPVDRDILGLDATHAESTRENNLKFPPLSVSLVRSLDKRQLVSGFHPLADDLPMSCRGKRGVTPGAVV
jgi:hypothetical protein